METAVDVEKISSILECGVCLEKFNNPKMLRCNHLFCKGCLEEIIEFRADGSAIIQCPLRCEQQTFIGDNQTIDGLGSSYEIKAVLETLKTSDKSLVSPCTYSKSCNKDISFYCCGHSMCKDCHTNHNQTQRLHKGKTNVVFDGNNGKVKVLCNEHSSKCSHLCIDPIHGFNNNFLCMYCMHRGHKGHTTDTIEYQATKIREILTNDFKKTQNVCELRKITEENIKVCRQKLDNLLRVRKVERLSKYLDLLNKEEESIKREFDLICCNHIQQYPMTIDPEYYEKKVEKDEIELVMEKAEIINTICTQNMNNISLRYMDVSLSDDFEGKHPLGELKVLASEPLAFTDVQLSVPTLKVTTTDLSHGASLRTTLFSRMKELLQPDPIPDTNQIYQDSDIFRYLQTPVSSGASNIRPRSGNTSDSTAEQKITQRAKSQEEKSKSNYFKTIQTNKSLEEKVTQPIQISKEESDSNKLCGCVATEEIDENSDDITILSKRGMEYIKELIPDNKVRKLQHILEKRADVVYLRSGSDGITPLLLAVQCNKVNVMQLLVEYGANIYEKDDWGKSALHIAARNNSVDALKWLLARWQSWVDGKTSLGHTPLDLARKYNHKECIEELRKWMEDHPIGIVSSITRMFWS